MSDPPPLVVREVPGGDIEAECSGCGERHSITPDPVCALVRTLRAFIDQHACCAHGGGVRR
jgi:hypothetical protein